MSVKSQLLYKDLICNFAQDLRKEMKEKIGSVFYQTALLPPSDFNNLCYELMYLRIRDNPGPIPSREELQGQIPSLKKTCRACENFFLNCRTYMWKDEDVEIGKRFERPTREWLNSRGILVFPANEIDPRLPDIGIKNRYEKVAAFLEVKYHNAPFINARHHVSKDTECYEGSLTIDVGKMKNQIAIAKRLYPEAPLLILHWVDFPCIKTILWGDLSMPTEEYVFERRHRPGDYKDERQIGYTQKVYHFLRHLKDLSSLIEYLKNLQEERA
jgi:hypothetical protein